MIRATETAILSRIVEPAEGNLEPSLAHFILGLDFPAADHRRIQELSSKAQEGTLTSDERDDLEGYLNVGDFLAIMQSKARVSLRSDNGRRAG